MISDATTIEKFILAGKATFTLESERTGNHFTYRVIRKENVHFVRIMTSGESRYAYAGFIRDRIFRTTQKSAVAETDLSVKSFIWYWGAITNGRVPTQAILHHMNRCGKCGRELTDPASLERGIGPECAEKLGIIPQPKRRRRKIAA